jgi:DNA-binding IclR family transcriptional regulator
MNILFIYELIKGKVWLNLKISYTQAMEIPATRYSAPALEKGLDILEYLAPRTVPRSKAEIAEDLNRTPSEIYRMLTVLEQRGYVRKQPGTSSYSLSLKLFELGHLQSGMTTLRKAIRQPMEQLADGIGQACHFSIQNGTDLLVIMERMPSRRICLAVGEGTTLPITQSASGYVQLSQMDKGDLQDFLKSDSYFQQLSATKQKASLKRIEKIRSNGYETAHSLITPGIIDISLPIGIPNSDLSGALAVSLFCDELDAAIIQQTRSAIQKCAQQINRNLGI